MIIYDYMNNMYIIILSPIRVVGLGARIFVDAQLKNGGGGLYKTTNPGADLHRLTMSDPSMLAQVYAPTKTTFAFCRGRRVCPTETIRKHGEKTDKLFQNRSNTLKRRNVDRVFFVTWFTLIGVVDFLDCTEIAPNLCVTCHLPGFHNECLHKFVPYTFCL